MKEYINRAKDLIDFFLAIGDMLGDCEQVLYVLRGLDVNYTFLVTIITNKK